MPDDMTQNILGALNKLDTKLDGVKESIDTMKEQSAKQSERIAEIEVWKNGWQRDADRWWSQTWPNHEAVIAAIEQRLRMAEQNKATQQKIEEIEKRVREVEEAKAAAAALTARVDTIEEVVEALKEFKTTVTIKMALILGGASVVGAALVTAVMKLVFHV